MSLADVCAAVWPSQEQHVLRGAAAASAAAARHHALNWLDLCSCYPRRSTYKREDEQDYGDNSQRLLSSFEASLVQLIRDEARASALPPLHLPARARARHHRRAPATLSPSMGRPQSPINDDNASFVDCCATQSHVTLENVPHGVRGAFSARGIISLWDWQAELLSNLSVVRDRSNALVCLPSGSGKSVAADLLLLRAVLQTGKSAVLALPYQSGVHEKLQTYEAMVPATGLWVQSHDALSSFPQLPSRPTLCVCT